MLTDKFLKLQVASFRQLGFNLLDGSWLHPCRTACSAMSLLTFLPLTVAFCVRNAENVDNLTDGLCSVLIDLLALFKLALILWLHKDFERLIQQFRCILTEESQTSEYAQIIDRINGREQFISGLYKNCFSLAAASAFLLPLVRRISALLLSTPVEPELPFPSVYPWDNRKALNYLVSYVWNVSAGLGVLLPTVCVDTLFCSLAHNLCALFEIAQHKMKHFVDASLEASLANLAHSLPLYQQSLDMSLTLNRLFRPLINMQFLIAAVHLCVLSYQLATNLSQPEVLFYAAFTASMLAQIYLYCYSGAQVKEQSEKFALAVYSSAWYELGGSWSDIGRPLLLSMMRAQRGSRIDGHFLEASMGTFLSIVKTAISYTTLLQSLSK